MNNQTHPSTPKKEIFYVEDVKIIDQSTRALIAKWVLILATFFLLCAGIFGLLTGNFDSLTYTMMFVEAPVFTILGYYFGKDT